MGIFIKDGAYWIEFYVHGKRKRQRIGSPISPQMKKLAEDVYSKRRVEVAEGKFLDVKRASPATFNDLCDAYLAWIRPTR